MKLKLLVSAAILFVFLSCSGSKQQLHVKTPVQEDTTSGF